VFFDHALVYALGQLVVCKLGKCTAEGGFAGQALAQVKAAQAAQLGVALQALYQCLGGDEVEHRLGQKGTRQGAAICLGLATPRLSL
jgi:hypothetical protein